MNLSNVEKETIILFNEAEKTAIINSSNSRITRRCEELLKTHPEEVQRTVDSAYILPNAWIRINPTRSVEYTEEQLEQKRENLRALHAKRRNLSSGS